MLVCMHYLRDAFIRLKNFQDRLQKEMDILKKREERAAQGKQNRERTDITVSNVKVAVNNAFLDFAMAIEESKFISDNTVAPLNAIRIILPVMKDRLVDSKTVEDIYRTLKMLTDPLVEWFERKNDNYLSTYDYNREFRNYYNYNDADMDSVAAHLITQAIKWRSDPVNVFDMFCRKGVMSTKLQEDHNNVNVYGLDPFKNINRSSAMFNTYKRVIYGQLKGSVITNGCFDIVHCMPNITLERILQGGVYIKTEREMLTRVTDYLRPEGVLIYVLPYYRFYKEICDILVKNYEDFQIFTTDHDISSCGLVYVVCKRMLQPARPDLIDIKAYAKLRNIPVSYLDLPVEPTLSDITLPAQHLDVKRFRGSELNEFEMAELHNSSRCTISFWKDQAVEKLGESRAKPLLPFNIGQLGLILTSGCLDGIVDEGNGYCHAVKGRVIKRVDTTESMDIRSHQVQVVNTTSNRVEISAFLPDGTYKCLA